MRRVIVAAVVSCTTAIIGISVFPPSNLLIWNRTQSAPKGLYYRSNGPLDYGAWAIVSGGAPASIWIANNGYLARDWPIIKRVSGLSSDEICRVERAVSVNGNVVATALETDSAGKELPDWQGCFVVAADEVFLLNDHPRSLDGRYFGATDLNDVAGAAHLLLRVP